MYNLILTGHKGNCKIVLDVFIYLLSFLFERIPFKFETFPSLFVLLCVKWSIMQWPRNKERFVQLLRFYLSERKDRKQEHQQQSGGNQLSPAKSEREGVMSQPSPCISHSGNNNSNNDAAKSAPQPWTEPYIRRKVCAYRIVDGHWNRMNSRTAGYTPTKSHFIFRFLFPPLTHWLLAIFFQYPLSRVAFFFLTLQHQRPQK